MLAVLVIMTVSLVILAEIKANKKRSSPKDIIREDTFMGILLVAMAVMSLVFWVFLWRKADNLGSAIVGGVFSLGFLFGLLLNVGDKFNKANTQTMWMANVIASQNVYYAFFAMLAGFIGVYVYFIAMQPEGLKEYAQFAFLGVGTIGFFRFLAEITFAQFLCE